MNARGARFLLAIIGVMTLAAPSAGAAVVINEIMYHSAISTSDEYVEIYNNGASVVSLSDWTLEGTGFVFPAGATIGAGQYKVIAKDAALFESRYDRTADFAPFPGDLSNSGERLALVDSVGAVIDEVTYDDQPPWPVTPDGLGPSLEVIDAAQDNSTPQDWRASTDPSGGTPGRANSVAAGGLPPWIAEVHATNPPVAWQPICVTARVIAATSVSLTYLINFGAPATVPMNDDGASGDGAAGDGVYGASIPGQAVNTLVRFRIAATGPTGSMTHPRGDDTVTYDGTMVPDPSLTSALPIFQWFMDPARYQAAVDHATSDETEPAVLFWNGVVYDNVKIRARGQSSRYWPKLNWKFFFPQGHEFYDAGLLVEPVDNFDLQAAYSDKSYMREYLSWRSFQDAGMPAEQAFHVRLQQNGAFYGLYLLLEDPDKTWLERNGLDTEASRYKAESDLSQLGSAEEVCYYYEKLSRLDEDCSDLYAFIVGINQSDETARRDFLLDNVNIPGMINYNAVTTVFHNNDHPAKNYFLYRDTNGTGRWTMHPWDLDLTFGRNYNADGVLNDTIWANKDSIAGRPGVSPSHPLFGDSTHQKFDYFWNHLIDALHNEPDLKEMYYRRLRTVMDQILAPGLYEATINQLSPKISPEVALDKAAWEQWGTTQTLNKALFILKNSYLAVRRTHLFTTHRVSGEIPTAQSASPLVVINELMYAPAGGSDWEFVELYNPSSTESVDLSNWRIEGIGLTIPPGTVILANKYVLLVKNDVAFRAHYGSGKFVAAQYTGNLADEGERIVLRDRTGREVSSVTYSNSTPWPSGPAGGGFSLELKDASKATSWAANWAASTLTGGTPGAVNSVVTSMPAFPNIFINEVLPANASINKDEAGDADPWIELYNADSSSAAIGGMMLTDDFAVPGKWSIPAGVTLCSHCFTIIWTDAEPAEGTLHASFRLSSTGGSVALFTSGGVLADYINYPAEPRNISYGRFPDGNDEKRAFSHVTPAAANDAAAVPMILNEYNAVDPTKYLANSGSDVYWGRIAGNGDDWFELVVTRDRLDARGYQFVVSDDTGGTGQTTRVLTLTNASLWSNLRSGAIITVSQGLADNTSFDPAAGDWWINVQAADTGSGSYITAQNFPVSNKNWQLTIKDALGNVVFGPAGEGINPASGVGGDEICKLEANPGPYITPYSTYNDGTSSTFGAPNIWGGGTLTQDFTTVRCGGQDCSVLDGVCVIGVCDSGVGSCTTRPAVDGQSCSDGDACTVDDQCTNGTCAGTPRDCSQFDDQCNVGVCSSATGECQAQPDRQGLPCDDSFACTTDDVCDSGACTGTTNDALCDDENICTIDYCLAVTGCNHSAQPDGDSDDVCDPADCAPANATVWAIPAEVKGDRFTADKATFLWDSLSAQAGPGTRYHVMRGSLAQFPVGGGTAETCLTPPGGATSTSIEDATKPAMQTGFYYLVRGINSCGPGTYGYRSNGVENETAICP